jgi:hypothetical protein
VIALCSCVTPHIVVPSKAVWSQKELQHHAAMAVAAIVINSGHNCNGTEVIVTAKGWPQREAFLKTVEQVLGDLYERWPWCVLACAFGMHV